MQIGDSDVRIIKEWVDNHWEGEPLCPICKNNNWAIGKTIAELRPFLKGKLSSGGLIYPAIVFSCNVCGHTLLFNALALGIVKLPPPDKVAPPKEGDGVIASPDKVAPPKEKEGDDNG